MYSDIVTRRFRDHWGGLFEQPEVHLITDEGRSFVRRSNEQYDVIVSVDTYSGTAVASGALTLAESYILTREAFEDYWNHLTPNGVLLVTGYDTTKLMSTARAMSDKLGVSDPGSHLFAYVGRGAAFGHFSLNSGFVLQKSPLSAGEVAEMARRAGIDGVNHPQEPRQPAILYSPFAEPHDVYQNLLADLAKSPDPEKVYAKFETYYPNPATDDKPFFHQTQRWGLHHLGFRSYFSSGFYTARNAQVTLVVLLIQSSLVAAVMILLPMVRFKRSALSARGCGTLLVYFASLGLGYVLIEIIFLQRFQLFLGPPIYTFSVVLAGLLTFTGLGSFAANGFPTSSLRLLSWLLLGVVAVITLELLVMPIVFNWALGFALAWRVTVSIALLAPVGLLLGMPFPIGLRLLGEEDSQLVPWAWAINAFFTVIGSVSAVILAMILGFTTVEMIAAACYVAALVAIAIRARLLATVAQPSLRQIAYSSPLSPGKEGFGIVNSSVSAPGGMSIVNRSISAKGGISSSLSSEEHERVISELKRIAHDLNLTEQQVATLQSTLGRAREGVTQYIKNHPNATKAEIIAKTKEHRVEIRQRVESFLSLEQLAKWDAEMTKTKEFLGQKLEV